MIKALKKMTTKLKVWAIALKVVLAQHKRLKYLLPASTRRLYEIQYFFVMRRNVYVPLHEINDWCIEIGHKAFMAGQDVPEGSSLEEEIKND